MNNMKIRVNSANESREAQELLFELDFQWRGLKSPFDLFYPTSMDNYYIVLTKGSKEMQIAGAFRGGLGAWKEITLPELRAMAEPKMKEYLMPRRNYEYILTDARDGLEPHAKDWIEIPDGAECLTKCKDRNGDEWLLFWKGDYKFCVGHDKEWFYFESGVSEYLDEWCGLAKVIWQREQDEPFLTPECTLNDQYAEIEEVRQAIKVKSGSDLNHALDAMSFGLMGVGAANGGAKMRENDHYFIDVSDVDEVDFYEIAKRYNVTDPAIQHILKKCLAIGNRGHKDLETDLKDILKTAKRALQINGFGE